MNKIPYLTLGGLAWLLVLATPLARGWTYQDGDVLLVFRAPNADDVEFDIGNISQFLGQSNGYSAPVTGWDLSLVTSNFGPTPFSPDSPVSVILVATTAADSWVTVGGSVTSVDDVTVSAYHSQIYGVIDAIGARPVSYNVPPTEPNAYVITTSGDQTSLASYDFIVTDGGINAAFISELGGNVPFNVEGVIPATLGFWQIQPANAYPNPEPAATYVGSFDIDANGVLIFVVGSLQPAIEGFTQQGNGGTVRFTTLANGAYSLLYTNALGGPISTWPVVSGPIAGTGGVQSLSYTNAGDTAGYYGVVRSP
jgi:hypothetical protein